MAQASFLGGPALAPAAALQPAGRGFDGEGIARILEGKRIGGRVVFYGETDSTNKRALALAAAGAPEGTLVVADAQTQGRGRLYRRWESPPGRNLYCSAVLRPPLPPEAVPRLNIVAGVAVADLLEWLCPGRVRLKWPNDALLGGKKVSGILSEARLRRDAVDGVVVGIGVNVQMAAEDFPPPLRAVATSLLLETGERHDRLVVLAVLCDLLGRHYDRYLREGFSFFQAAWAGYADVIGRAVSVRFGDETLSGIAEGIDDTGALVLVGADGARRRIMAGDAAILAP